MAKDTTTVVRVRVEVEVSVGAWGPDCTIGQAYQQAADEAEERVRALCAPVQGVRFVAAKSLRAITEAER